MTPPPPTPAEAIRGLLEALLTAYDRGVLVQWGYTRAGECVKWKCLACGVMYMKPDALPLMNMAAPLPADMRCDRAKCLTTIARAALASWEARARLRDDETVKKLVNAFQVAAHLSPDWDNDKRINSEFLDNLDAALLGHPGTAKERT